MCFRIDLCVPIFGGFLFSLLRGRGTACEKKKKKKEKKREGVREEEKEWLMSLFHFFVLLFP